MRKQILVMVAIALAVACGGSPTSPGAPPAGAGTLKAVRVTLVAPLEVGANSQLQATAVYADGSNVPVTDRASWTSAPPGLLTVAPNGVASAVKYGKATIQARFGGQVGELTTQVLGRPVAVTVHIISFNCVADCDDALNGEGDFVYHVVARGLDADDASKDQSVTYETPGYPSSQGEFKLGAGEQRTIDKSRTFNLRDQPGNAVSVRFEATEWDTLGKDDRLNASWSLDVWNYGESFHWGAAPGRHTITLGSGACLVRLQYELGFDYTK